MIDTIYLTATIQLTMKTFYFLRTIPLIILLLLCACQTKQPIDGPPKRDIDVSTIPNPTPKVEEKSKYGNPSTYSALGHQYTVLNSADGYDVTGIASWYGTKFNHRRTSSGEPYNMFAMTGANKVLPLPTYVQVTNLDNGKQIIVKINDRGPFHEDRVIDLSYVAAKKLDILQKGTSLVRVQAIDPIEWRKANLHETNSNQSQKLYLQVGAFTNINNAVSLKQELLHHDFESVKIVDKGKTEHTTFYTVIIGPIKDTNTSARLQKQLDQLSLKSFNYIR